MSKTPPPIVTAAPDEFLISRTLRAPRAKVWQAWTDPRQLARGWGPHIIDNPECALDVRVFEAFADPKQVVKWWGPNGFVTRTITSDFRVGGAWRYTMTGPDGRVFPNKNIFVEIVPGQRIVYDSVQDNGEGQPDGPAHFRSTISFAGVGEVTRITLSLLFPTIEGRDFVMREHKAVEGGRQTLARLAGHLAMGQ